MHTQCSRCQTIFRINAAHLNIAQGHVRCSHCHHIFNAASHLIKELPSQEAELQAVMDGSEDLDEELDSNFPELLREDYISEKRSWRFLFFWMLVSGLLSASLIGQYIWLMHPEKILQHAQLRPWLEGFCHTFLCTLPPTRDVALFQMKEHVVRSHPTVADAIQVDATFVNRATFSQPYPILQLTFQDINGKPTAQRCFEPEEYLNKPKITGEIKPNASIHIQLELVDLEGIIAGEKVMKSYNFEFL